MDVVTELLNLLQQIETKEKEQTLKLLIKITDNIINNPTNDKYKNINLAKISKYPNIINILQNIGFTKNENGTRILLHKNQLNELKIVNKLFKSMLVGNNNVKQIKLTTDNDRKSDRRLEIIKQTKMKQIDHTQQQTDAVQKLLSIGFKEDIALFALSMFNNDINAAAQFIINQNQITTSQNNNICDNNDEKKGDDANEANNCKYPALNCIVTVRIGKILKYYSEHKQTAHTHNIYEYINNEFNDGEYSNTCFINDYHHLLFQHDFEFEDIYNYFIGQCVLKQKCSKSCCNLLKRNNFDRHQCSLDNRIRKRLYYTDCSKEMFVHQMIDKIHCYYLHSFDIGYRLTKHEKLLIDELKEDATNSSKASKCIQIIQSKQNSTNKPTKFKSTDHRMFSVGYYFFYPDYDPHGVSNRADELETQLFESSFYTKILFVKPKYSTLKAELLDNDLCTISMNQWEVELEKAKHHLVSDYCISRNPASKPDDITYAHLLRFIGTDSAISSAQNMEEKAIGAIVVDHLIAALIYCGFSLLSSTFSATYRKLTDGETDETLVKMHSSFANLGIYLSQYCELFATQIHGAYYHGICEKLYFDHTAMLSFLSPISTSTDFAVALNFCGSDGLILTLEETPTMDSQCNGTSCSWISPFTNECETLFFLHDANIWITEIAEASTGNNYHCYLIAFNYIQTMFTTAETIMPQSPTTKQTIARVISHELHRYDADKYPALQSMPKYMEALLHYYCINKHAITITMDLMLHGLKCIRYFFSNADGSFIDLETLVTFFPNLTHIDIGDWILWVKVTPVMLKETILFIKNSNKLFTLKQIEFIFGHELPDGFAKYQSETKIFAKYQSDIDYTRSIYALAESLEATFDQCGWTILACPAENVSSFGVYHKLIIAKKGFITIV